MGLLVEIQEALLDENAALSAAMLKARVLADRLGSDVFGEWIAQEVQGYADEAEVPDYRLAELIYTGNFINMAYKLEGMQVPLHIIRKEAGEHWAKVAIRSGIGVIESLIKGHTVEELNQYGVPVADLIPFLNNKVYEGYSCTGLNSKFVGSPFVTIQQSVRARLLELTLEIERQYPAAKDVTIRETPADVAGVGEPISQIVHQQIFMAPVSNVSQSGDHRSQTINVVSGDPQSLLKWLTASGIDEGVSQRLSQLVQEDAPDPAQLEGEGAWRWIKAKLGQGASAAIEVGKEASKDIVVAGVKAYFGLA